ncbi:DUF1579 domain-containing protein [Dyadobacter flavalbus]|uniref:DUF1579 domain-containing protein n=1 Tax=Dyadobacter flavalbus TaxID=2579942 RepID=A0A5M8QSY0_9BACT|nr:DUF1579 domain-containing protein [Dyadobacter flavalbus]KAA6439365.1 DUF1579 domain-containing protein [Dyadobacter flavalbus]
MSKSKFEISLESGIHQHLQAMTGDWEGNTKTWFEPGVIADESPMTASIRPILGGRFLLFQYQGSLDGTALEGSATIGYDLENEKFQVSWIDSFHMGTAIMHSEGSSVEHGFSVLGSYGGPEIPVPWGWRTVMQLVELDQLVVTAYNISPEGKEDKATETIFRRVKDTAGSNPV